jgi:hypothetical protein
VKPLEERRIAFVDYPGERLVPQHMLASQPCPETLEVAFRLGAQRAVGVHPRNIGLFDERFTRREDAGFLQNGFDHFGRHAFLRWRCSIFWNSGLGCRSMPVGAVSCFEVLFGLSKH